MKTLAEVSEFDSLYYFLKRSIQTLQQLHATGISHGSIEPLTLRVDSSYELLEGTIDTKYAAPEIVFGLAIVENYAADEAIRLWKSDSSAMKWIEKWLPAIAEDYTTKALQKLIGTPIPEQQSDIWSLGLSYLSMYDILYKKDVSFSEKDLFFEALSSMLRLRGRSFPTVEPSVVVASSSVAPPSGRMILTEPIHRGERNKTRRNLRN